MTDHASNDNAGREPLRRIVISRPDSAFETVIIPLEGELRKALTVNVESLEPPPRLTRRARASTVAKDGSRKPPRLPRPPRLRWWERLAYAWRGL
jgi:hypothetical protein